MQGGPNEPSADRGRGGKIRGRGKILVKKSESRAIRAADGRECNKVKRVDASGRVLKSVK